MGGLVATPSVMLSPAGGYVWIGVSRMSTTTSPGAFSKGQGADFPVGFAELLNIGAIKGEQIIVQYKH